MQSPTPTLVEIDALEIQIIVDNELDPLSQPAPSTVQLAGGSMGLIALTTSPSLPTGERGEAVKELRMEDICCAAHGLSIMIVRRCRSIIYGLLFSCQMFRSVPLLLNQEVR